MHVSSRLKDVDHSMPESLFDLVVTRRSGSREGWLMLPSGKPLCLLLTAGMAREDVEAQIELLRTAADQANNLPV